MAIEKSRQPQIDTRSTTCDARRASPGAIVHQENSLQSNRFQPHNGEVRRGVSVVVRADCCDAVVAVMEAADFWNRDNATG